jgi:hypothetical protein
MIVHRGSNRLVRATNLLDGGYAMKICGCGLKSYQRRMTMRVVALALASMLAVFAADTQAFAAKKSASVANPDRQYYQGAARGCGGGAYCYKAQKKKH